VESHARIAPGSEAPERNQGKKKTLSLKGEGLKDAIRSAQSVRAEERTSSARTSRIERRSLRGA